VIQNYNSFARKKLHRRNKQLLLTHT